MAYTVKSNQTGTINLAPGSTKEAVLQNVAVILSTPKFTVPLDRGFGLSQRFIDARTPSSRALLIAEVYEAIEEYEPRARVLSVTFEQGDREGAQIAVVEVEVDG